MVEPTVEADLSSRPEALAAQLLQARAAYQSSLVAAAQARREYDARVNEAKEAAEAERQRFKPDMKLVGRCRTAWRTYGQPDAPDIPERQLTLTDLRGAEKVWRAAALRCEVEMERHRDMLRAWQEKRKLFGKGPAPRLPMSFRDDLVALVSIAAGFGRLQEAHAAMLESDVLVRLKSEFDLAAAEREQRLVEQMDSSVAALRLGVDLLGVHGQSWRQVLADPTLSNALTAATRLGVISGGLPHAYAVEVPCVIAFPAARCLALEASMVARESALSLLRSVMLRVLMDVPPGGLQLSMIDPTGLGQTFADLIHLGDYDERLIDSGVKTSAQAIERCLEENVAHVETVISKYLRGSFTTIHDYNLHAGELAEPYRLIVVADYPRQFTDRSCEYLLSLVENGPRCGVYVVLLYSPEEGEPRTLSFERLTQSVDLISWQGQISRIRLDGQVVEFTPDQCPEIAFDVNSQPMTDAARALDAIGRAAKKGGGVAVTLESFLPLLNRNRTGVLPDLVPGAPLVSLLPDSWWHGSTADRAVAPLGRSGAQGVASMWFSSTSVAGGAIMVGLPSSGKTTSLHAMVLTMAMLYSPDELELYLIDAKHGIEFKAYETLPHARMVSIHSDREFSVAVLESLRAKIRERGEIFKAHGGSLTNLTEYRAATGKVLPRIVLVIDEFHEIFEEADKIGTDAFAAFSDIVRMGRAAGVHLVVASQTLSSMPAMDRQTLTLLPQRVVFMCNEYDAEIVMGDTNKAPKLLSQTGEGLFNPSRGDESKNQPFRGLYVTPDQRALLLRELRDKADAAGWLRGPRVFDGDAVVDRPEVMEPASGSRFSVTVGEPFTLADSESIVFPRSRGGNVLLVGDRDDESTPDLALRGVLHSVLLAAAAQGVEVTIVDLLGEEDDGPSLSVLELAERTGARYIRSRGLDGALAEMATEVSARASAEDYRARTRLLILFGVHRGLALTPYDPYYDSDSERVPPPTQVLAEILANGPEVGVHVIVDVDRAHSLDMRLGSDLVGELTTRIVGSGGDQPDLRLAVGGYGDVAPVRFGQILIADQLKGTTKRVRGYRTVQRSSH